MTVRILTGDCLETLRTLPAESVNCCVTSPPYWGLRDYGVAGQLGLEATPEEYVAKMVAVFREVRRVLREDGTLWLNLGDSYAGNGGATPGKRSDGIGQAHSDDGLRRTGTPGGLKPKDLVGIPWRVAFALQADGWWLRSDIIWHKPNPMPESVTDRPTKAHEYVFLMAKSETYEYDAAAVAEKAIHGGDLGLLRRPAGTDSPDVAWHAESVRTRQAAGVDSRTAGPLMRNARTVWTINSEPFAEAHFATMPTRLVERCVKAGSAEGGHVLDPFGGAGTTGLVAQRLGRSATLIELNPTYAAMARKRIDEDAPLFAGGAT